MHNKRLGLLTCLEECSYGTLHPPNCNYNDLVMKTFTYSKVFEFAYDNDRNICEWKKCIISHKTIISQELGRSII